MLKLVGFVLGFLLFIATCSAAKKRSQYKIFENMVLGENANYDKTTPRLDSSVDPVIVKFSFYIISLKVDSMRQEMELNLYVKRTWNDTRLRFDDEDKETLSFDSSATNDIWLPDTFISNGIDEKRVGTNNVLLKIYKDGKIWMAEKVIVRVQCAMNLQKFPFDTQECPLTIESFKYKTDSVILKFLDDMESVVFGESVGGHLGEFTLKNTKLLDCATNYTSGAYPCLRVGFVLARDGGSFSKHQFFPSAILLLFAYTSTWMGNQILLPRTMVLIVSSVLLSANIVVSSVVLDNPVVGYLTAGDLWYIIVVILLMVAIIEFCIVARLCNKTDGIPEDTDSRYLKCGNVIDWIFRIVFLIVIIIFFCGYFTIYMIK